MTTHGHHGRPKAYGCGVNIPPDTKDWTWVLREPCRECGFEAGSPARDDLAALTLEVSRRWQEAMAAAPDPTDRPVPMVWSPLEYACHVRDVFAIATYRVGLMLDQDDPQFPNWDQDATAIEDDYAAQDPGVVTGELVARAAEFAAALDAVDEEQWGRGGGRSDGATFTVESFGRYLLHDPIHHLTDVTRTSWA
jgi:hypothetical protein